MNSTLLWPNIIRFLFLVLLQGLILQRVAPGGMILEHLHLFVYPIFILLLPIRTPTTLVVLLGFVVGLAVDILYSSIGIHAAASVATAGFRRFALSWLEPVSGYNVQYSPTPRRLGMNWFLRYAAILLAIHLLWYYSVEAYTFAYWRNILSSFVVSYPFSLLLVYAYIIIAKPLE